MAALSQEQANVNNMRIHDTDNVMIMCPSYGPAMLSTKL